MSVFELVIDALNRSGARYVIVGGFAVNVRGYQRFTSDLDLAIDLAPRSATLLIAALESIGFRNRVGVTASEIADPATRGRWITEKGAKVISFLHSDHPTFAVDIFIDPPLDFNELHAQSSEVPLGPLSARIASIAHLIQMKRLAAREVDLQDIRALEFVLQQRREQS